MTEGGPVPASAEPLVLAHQSEARADWEARIYRRLVDTADADPRSALPMPAELRATSAVGHVRLSWNEVPGAAGYVIERTAEADGLPVLLHHGGSDVAAVAGCEFADTGIEDDVDYRYRVGAIAGAEFPVWQWSEPVRSRALGGLANPVGVRVDASTVTGGLHRVWRMVGSERLSQLRLGVDDRGHHVGSEFAESLRQAHTDLGVSLLRAHAILHDDNNVVHRDGQGRLQFDFSRVDSIYDQLLALGIRPVVELSFMPRALARDPELTVFTYRGIISPPADWEEWGGLVGALAAHLVDRYGIEEVAGWAFEVWNEPNLVVFWSGTQQEYLQLYDASARAIKSVNTRLRVGGPATAASEWVESLASHARAAGVALDFASTHTYGNLPLDTRPALERSGFGDIPVWWTEWGVGSTHFGSGHDGVIGAPFVLSGFLAAQGRLDALAYWVISDHFEELGRPPRLFHDGFGLLSVGNLRKPRYWAVHLAAHLGESVLASSVDGDGAGVLVQAWGTRHADGTVDVLVWNGTINAAMAGGDPRLDRTVRLRLTALDGSFYRVARARVDERHSNVVSQCPADVVWPDEKLWAHLRECDELYEERLPDVRPVDGATSFDFHLPMPGIVRIRLSAGQESTGTVEGNTR